MRVARGQHHQQIRQRLGQGMRIGGGIRLMHLGHARQLGRSLGRRVDGLAGDEDMHFAELQRRRNGAAGGLLDFGALEIEEDEGRHQITFASVRSFCTSSAAELTFLPATRRGGSATLTIVRRGAGSTPSASGLIVSIGFLRAFMMFGSDA